MKNAKRIIWWILTVLTMVIIFTFSSETAVDSSDTSERFMKVILDFLPFTKGMSETSKLEFIESMDFLIRKCAHFTLYALLGFVTFGAVKSTFITDIKDKIKYSFLIALVYATFDEIHQYFVPGRACRLYDIAIDSVGSIFGISVFLLLVYLSDKYLNKKAKQ